MLLAVDHFFFDFFADCWAEDEPTVSASGLAFCHFNGFFLNILHGGSVNWKINLFKLKYLFRWKPDIYMNSMCNKTFWNML